MRYYQFQPKQNPEQIEEVRMGSSDFQKFLKTPLAKSMQAGFEAELIFQGLADSDDYDMEPDWDEDRRARNIQQIIDFFTDGDYATLTSREVDQLQDRLFEDYMEYDSEILNGAFRENRGDIIEDYVRDNISDYRDLVEDLLRDGEGLSDEEIEELFSLNKEFRQIYRSGEQREFKEQHPEFQKLLDAQNTVIDEIVERSIDEEDDLYWSAFEDFQENWDGSDQEDWLRNNGLEYMSDVRDRYELDWPYMTRSGYDEGGFSESSAEDLSDSLARTLGVETEVSTGYHTASRDDKTWIFEPDSSLSADNPDDMPVEIISPPMSLDKAVEIIPKFFKWAESQGAYSNSSTGFHMSVSMPDHDESKLDFVKLALFLGDEYVLKRFGREANGYARSAMDKIKQRGPQTPEKLAEYMEQMRKGINTIAKNSLASSSGFGKYTSINPKEKYVEFRSAGGEDYMQDMKRLQDTLARYGMALTIAMDPEAEKQEYTKKLYKLLDTGVKKDEDVISIFSRYVAQEMPASALKSYLKNIQYKRQGSKSEKQASIDPDRRARAAEHMPELNFRGNYEIFNRESGNSVYPFVTDSDASALGLLEVWKVGVMSPELNPDNFGVRRRSTDRQNSSDSDDIDRELPFMVTYSLSSGSRGNHRVDARNQAEARQKFLQLAGRTVNLDEITIHDVRQLG